MLTQRCPGQVGGGWEETDSSTSSHNSSQDITSNSRTSAGSQNQSAGSGSQSEASRESGGDASERWEAVLKQCGINSVSSVCNAHFLCYLVVRVDALQLGDCGQEMALISRLTEGTKVFLTREESQHFLKESVAVIAQNKVVMADMPTIYILYECVTFLIHQVLHSQLRGCAGVALKQASRFLWHCEDGNNSWDAFQIPVCSAIHDR